MEPRSRGASAPTALARALEKIEPLRSYVKTLWLIVGISLVMYVAIELSFYVALKILIHQATVLDPKYVASADAYAGAPWALKLLEDTDALRNRWEPYVYFAPKPHASEMLNIDEHGLRRTPGGQAAPPSSAVSVKMFGGSTMFGFGNRDAYTIPSILARLLREDGTANSHVNLVNHGRVAYVSTQEVIQLEIELKAGRLPDIVVFYDGINETETAMMGGHGGDTQLEGRLQKYIESGDESTLGTVKAMVGRSPTNRFFSQLRRRYAEADYEVRLRSVDVDALARDVAEQYFRNVEHVRKLGQIYAFDSRFYWQPTLHQKPRRTTYEETVLARPWHEGLPKTGSDSYTTLYRKVYEAVRSAQQRLQIAEFHDISALFAHDSTPRFIDPHHLSEGGNEVVARRMLEDLRPLIERRQRQRD